METQAQVDQNVENVIGKLRARSALGFKKYGVSTETLAPLAAAKHAQEESMDLSNYLEQLIETLEKALVDTARLNWLDANRKTVCFRTIQPFIGPLLETSTSPIRTAIDRAIALGPLEG